MGCLIDGEVSNLWRFEFKRHGIGFDEIVLIGNNLGELNRPEFIPNVFQLIQIVKNIHKNKEAKVAHDRVSNKMPEMLSKKETFDLRAKTKRARQNSFSAIKNILS